MEFKKALAGLILFAIIGLLGNTPSFADEEQRYIHLQIKYPNDLLMISLYKVPKSICETKLEMLSNSVLERCKECILEISKCTSELETRFNGIFDNKRLIFPYISYDMNHPERHIMLDVSESYFLKYCNQMKEKRPEVLCIR